MGMGGVIVVWVCVIGALVWGLRSAKNRKSPMSELADQLGLSFSSERNYQMSQRYGFLDQLPQGSNRYAYNFFSGSCQGYEVEVFDYHYETQPADAQNKREIQSSDPSFFILTLGPFPEAPMKTYLEDSPDLQADTDSNSLVLRRDGILEVGTIEEHLNHLVTGRSQMPEHLFKTTEP